MVLNRYCNYKFIVLRSIYKNSDKIILLIRTPLRFNVYPEGVFSMKSEYLSRICLYLLPKSIPYFWSISETFTPERFLNPRKNFFFEFFLHTQCSSAFVNIRFSHILFKRSVIRIPHSVNIAVCSRAKTIILIVIPIV